jgi:hypothetical protein
MIPKNQLPSGAMMFPKKSWGQPERSKSMVPECSESELQSYANELLELKKWQYLRFPDALLAWVKLHAPAWVQKVFFGQVGGRLPDNLIMLPLGNGLFLSLKLELKTADKQGRAVGKTHGKQKRYAEQEQWPIARTPEQINKELDRLEIIFNRVKKVLA